VTNNANGIIARLELDHREADSVKQKVEQAERQHAFCEVVLQYLPILVVVNLPKAHARNVQLDSLEQGEVPATILYFDRTYYSKEVGNYRQAITIRRTAVWLLYAGSKCINSAQGKTLVPIVCDLRTPPDPNLDPMARYTCLSRTDKLEHLALLQKVELKDLQTVRNPDREGNNVMVAEIELASINALKAGLLLPAHLNMPAFLAPR
jgi:hypothetical protein